MDAEKRDFMTSWLSNWIKAVDDYYSAYMEDRNSCQPEQDRVVELAPRALAIVKTQRPDVTSLFTYENSYLDAESGRMVAVEVRGIVRSKELTEKFLGNDAPQLSANLLHPMVWDAARSFWKDGYRTSAVDQACTAINTWIQDRVNRKDVSDSVLMAQVFSSSAPEEGKARLRWPGDPSDRTVRSMNQGLLNFSMGCFHGIRNPSAHTTDEMGESEALTRLSALSLLATWIDECLVVTANDSEPPF